MGDIANIVDLQGSTRAKPLSATYAGEAIRSEWARLVPGGSNMVPAAPQRLADALPGSAQRGLRSLLRVTLAELRPKFFAELAGWMVAPAIVDVALIILVYAFVCRLTTSGRSNEIILFIYLSVFLIFAAEENLYSQFGSVIAETCAVLRTSLWPMLLTVLSTRLWGSGSGLALLLFIAGSVVALLTARRIKRALQVESSTSRNVLIVGSGPQAQKVADAIHRNGGSGRVLKGFMAEHHLRNVYGPSMLSRIAREQFIDELIITSNDLSIAKVALEEGRYNGLDIRTAPEVCGLAPASEIAFENFIGIPSLKIHGQRFPQFALALKRALDIVIAFSGLIALLPLLLCIAAVIKFDSSGPVLYSAERIGRKGRKFSCHKFRTMVPEADAMKNSLRSRNQRQGAFFKIANDPRITRFGAFLRRYSLDELPQLWNVLVGDMSLVGPRPHPPDDVHLYDLQHLQRLDFVPGITGLWQVTARRDPSFERSVALDVEYIKTWNLGLDARILWRTMFAVLEGTGA